MSGGRGPDPSRVRPLSISEGGSTIENQHRKITGYRELDTDDIAVMNHIKDKEQEVLAMLDGLYAASAYDKRWVNIARTQLELGFMSAVRSVARPTPGHPHPDDPKSI